MHCLTYVCYTRVTSAAKKHACIDSLNTFRIRVPRTRVGNAISVLRACHTAGHRFLCFSRYLKPTFFFTFSHLRTQKNEGTLAKLLIPLAITCAIKFLKKWFPILVDKHYRTIKFDRAINFDAYNFVCPRPCKMLIPYPIIGNTYAQPRFSGMVNVCTQFKLVHSASNNWWKRLLFIGNQ
jgi:hypothetical protein